MARRAPSAAPRPGTRSAGRDCAAEDGPSQRLALALFGHLSERIIIAVVVSARNTPSQAARRDFQNRRRSPGQFCPAIARTPGLLSSMLFQSVAPPTARPFRAHLIAPARP